MKHWHTIDEIHAYARALNEKQTTLRVGVIEIVVPRSAMAASGLTIGAAMPRGWKPCPAAVKLVAGTLTQVKR